MISVESQKIASDLMANLLVNKYISRDHPLALSYTESEDVRNCIWQIADSFGIRVEMKSKYLHLLARPDRSIFANSISEMRKNVKNYESKIDLYLMGFIWMIVFAEADTEMSTKIRWEDEGLTYQQIEVLTTKALATLKKRDEDTSDAFSKDWSLSTKRMYDKWRLLNYNKTVNGRLSYSKSTKFGMIHSAMQILEKEKLVFIRNFSKTTIVTPANVFYERLQICFGNLDSTKNRYEKLKELLKQLRDSDKEGE